MDEYVLAIAKDFAPDILGFSSMSIGIESVKHLSRIFQKLYPDLFQIYGGIHAMLEPEESLRYSSVRRSLRGIW